MTRRDRTDSPRAAAMTDAAIRKNTQPMAAARLDVGRGDEPAGGQHGDTHAGDHQRPAPVAVRGQRVQGDEEPDPSGPVREVEGVVHQAGESGRDEHRHRPPAPHGQHQATHDQQDVAQVSEVGQRPRPHAPRVSRRCPGPASRRRRVRAGRPAPGQAGGTAPLGVSCCDDSGRARVTGYDDERDQVRAAYADLRRYCRPLSEDTPRSATRRSLP